jgi:hypothetical protein
MWCCGKPGGGVVRTIPGCTAYATIPSLLCISATASVKRFVASSEMLNPSGLEGKWEEKLVVLTIALAPCEEDSRRGSKYLIVRNLPT